MMNLRIGHGDLTMLKFDMKICGKMFFLFYLFLFRKSIDTYNEEHIYIKFKEAKPVARLICSKVICI